MSDDQDENIMEGQKSIYYDPAESYQLSSRPLHPSGFAAVDESPWSSTPTSPPPAPIGGTAPSETETMTLRDDDESVTASMMDGSYMGHVRAQAALPKKWLSEVDIEPYMRGTNGKMGKQEHGFVAKGSEFREPLLEELLPSSRKAALFPALQGPVPKRDVVFANIYWAALTIMIVLGFGLCLVYPAEMKDHIVRSGTLFRAIVDSVWILFTAVLVGSLLSTLWVLCLKTFPAQIVYGMVYVTPMASFAVGLTAAFEYLRGGEGGGWWLFLTAVGALVFSGALAMWSLANRKNIGNTVSIITMCSDVLSANPSIYLASLALLIGYVLFVALWVVFYAHALMLGRVSTIPDAVTKVWRLSGLSYYLQAYLIVMLVWTSTICASLQKCMIGGVVGKWYFFRAEYAESMLVTASSPSWDSLRAAFAMHFGQICLASLVLCGVRITRGLFHFYHYVASIFEGYRIASSMFRGLTLFFGFVERLLEHLSDLSLYFVSLTGESFWSSSRAVFKIFRRNMLLGFTADSMAQLVFTVTTGAAAVLIGLLGYSFISQSLMSPYGMAGAVLFAFVTWYVLKFFTGIFSDTMDAMFVCFAIDLDTKKLHCPIAHQAFTHRIVAEDEL